MLEVAHQVAARTVPESTMDPPCSLCVLGSQSYVPWVSFLTAHCPRHQGSQTDAWVNLSSLPGSWDSWPQSEAATLAQHLITRKSHFPPRLLHCQKYYPQIINTRQTPWEGQHRLPFSWGYQHRLWKGPSPATPSEAQGY